VALLEIARRAKVLRDTPDIEGGKAPLRTDEKYEQIILPGPPGSSPDSPMLDVPGEDWRWAVANWPHDRWSDWRRRVTAILTEADAERTTEDGGDSALVDDRSDEIRAAGRRAFDEMTRPSVFVGEALPAWPKAT
jgi:hypothetical protein